MRILQVVHGFPPAASGGTEIYTHDLSHALAALPETIVGVLTREGDPARPELSVRHTRTGVVDVFSITNTFRTCATLEESYEHPDLLRVACGVIDGFRPDVVHLQHLTCLSTGLPREIARRGIPVVLTLNDYWLLCHRGQLFDLDGARCEGPLDGGCARCIAPSAAAPGLVRSFGRTLARAPLPGAAGAAALAARAVNRATSAFDRAGAVNRTRAASLARLGHMRDAVSHVDCVLAPSKTMEAQFSRFVAQPGRRVRCEQGIALQPFAGHARRPSSVLRVAFAGGLLPSKGPHVLLDAVDRLPSGSVSLDLLGSAGPYHGDSGYAQGLAPRLGHPAVRRLGPVPHARMAAALHDVDVVAVPSVWIENAPFIIREAFAAGAPVVASDLGGMAEMVRHGIDGLLFPPGDATALAAQLRRLVEEPGLLDRLRQGIRRPLSIEEDAACLRGMYSHLIARAAAAAEEPVPPVMRASAPEASVEAPCVSPCVRGAGRDAPTASSVAAVVLNFRTPDQTWLSVRSLQTSFTPPGRILVVDNGSADGSVQALEGRLTDVDILANAVNLGFPGGCNVAIREALDRGAEYILLANSDVVLAPDALGLLLAEMQRDPRIGIAGPLLVSRQEPGWIASAGIRYSRRTGRMRQLEAGTARAAAAADGLPRPRVVDAVSGCVMLIRSAVFERTGLLDEAYFFSFEDIDLCLRAGDAGFRTACVRAAVAYHEGGGTIGSRSARRVYFATRNHLRLQAWSGPGASRPLRAALVVALNAAYVVSAPEAPLVAGLAAVARGTWDHLRGRYGAG